MFANHKQLHTLKIFSLALFLVSLLSACGDGSGKWWHALPGWGGYWWQRGQPKSVAQLFSSAQEKLSGNLQTFGSKRPELVKPAEVLKETLSAAVNSLASGASKESINQKLNMATETWFTLEGQLSVGSRAAYGELASEMRNFSRRTAGENVSEESFRESLGLFSARVLSFLANELSVPAPVRAPAAVSG